LFVKVNGRGSVCVPVVAAVGVYVRVSTHGVPPLTLEQLKLGADALVQPPERPVRSTDRLLPG
jgi:hypothetical protein